MYGRGRGWGVRGCEDAGGSGGRGGSGGSAADPDDALVRAARGGDDAAFARLLERHRPWVLRWVQAVVGDADQAEDVTQEAFYRVHRHLGDYQARGQFVPWVKRIALNLARNALRDQQRAHAVAAVLARPESATVLPPPPPDPAAVMESRLLQREVRDALSGLGPEHQRVLLLHYFAGLSVEEIAARTHSPPGTVKSRLHHARRQVRRALLPAADPDHETRS